MESSRRGITPPDPDTRVWSIRGTCRGRTRRESDVAGRGSRQFHAIGEKRTACPVVWNCAAFESGEKRADYFFESSASKWLSTDSRVSGFPALANTTDTEPRCRER